MLLMYILAKKTKTPQKTHEKQQPNENEENTKYQIVN